MGASLLRGRTRASSSWDRRPNTETNTYDKITCSAKWYIHYIHAKQYGMFCLVLLHLQHDILIFNP